MDSGLQTSLEHVPRMTNHIPMAQETLVEAFGMPEDLFTREREEHEPFVLASQAQMVYYVRDSKEDEWYCVIRRTPRDTYNMGEEDDFDTMQFTPNNFSNMQSLLGILPCTVEFLIGSLLPCFGSYRTDCYGYRMLLPLLLTMVNKRKQKLIQNIRGQELRDKDLQDEHESYDTTSNSQLDAQNGALELDQNEEFTEEMLTSQRQQNRHGRTVMRDVHALDPDDVLFQEKGRKPTRIEIIKISHRSKKRGDAPVDDEVTRVEMKLCGVDFKTSLRELNLQNDVFGLEHSGQVQCLGASALPSQVFLELCKRTIYTPSYHSNSNMTVEFKEMQEKNKRNGGTGSTEADRNRANDKENA
ncbi:hypothetical protein ZIOFF_032201 [Zingiber officinale]|uniref:DUF4216 domain-containing protein n=1 Tax=Zingiber officinale TaxID=94328 RepID=A0A8J5L116_ZINOF|nr:hypothetical protein ZIOFF_032201 [Zingiber officinale]